MPHLARHVLSLANHLGLQSLYQLEELGISPLSAVLNSGTHGGSRQDAWRLFCVWKSTIKSG